MFRMQPAFRRVVNTMVKSASPSTRAFATKVPRTNAPSVGVWGDLANCSRAVRTGDTVRVAGTCAAGDTPRDQMKAIFAIIEPALKEVGAGLEDVVHTRLFASDISADWEELGAAHAEILGDAKPACTLVGAQLLLPWMKVEVEVTAVVNTTLTE
eukprot:m.61114 g.61114  ORF g.61114 m.61114 type:complete len:155 (+) comp22934_c0_seq1:168-632(+)